MAGYKKIKRTVDLISNLPDVILQHILCFIPTELAITTSLLSRRWRHVWCEIPCLSLDADKLTAASINETLTRYTAQRTRNFQLKTSLNKDLPHVDRWIKWAMSHNVENLSLDLSRPPYCVKYKLPDFIYINSYVKQLSIGLCCSHGILDKYCTVSWTSLKKLSLSCCRLFDESMAKILSGCPILENLTLYHCDGIKVLDLSKSLRLRTLEVKPEVWGPTQIVAPHIHCLRLLNGGCCGCSWTLVDVHSLTEAKLEILLIHTNKHNDLIKFMVLKMLEKLQNAEKLTLGTNLFQILSLAKFRGIPFPMFKVKALTLDTMIDRYVIPGIERLVQNCPDLEKPTVRATKLNFTPLFDAAYLKLQGFNPSKCWRSSWNKNCWEVKSKHVVSFVRLMLKSTKKLDKMVFLFDQRYINFKIQDLVPLLSHNNNVTIVLSTTTPLENEW